jgi:glycine cleavage system H protein
MSLIPEQLKYVESHEWLRLEADGTISVGITDHAQALLGDIVFIDLPKLGAQVAASDEISVVESVKAASDIYAPIAGEIVAINETLSSTPEQVNELPYDAWFFKMKPANANDWEQLLDAAAYKALID